MMAGTLVCSCSSDAILGLHSSLFSPLRRRMAGVSPLGSRGVNLCQTRIGFTLVSTDKCSMKSGKSNSDKVSSEADENVPSWASPNTDEPPPWAREDGKEKLLNQSFEIPFYGYLLASAITAIAAIGSAFEYVNQKPVFGLLNSDSIFYAPLLGFFAFTGIPTSAFLWFKSVQAANKEAEEQDRRDGYL